MATHKQFYLTCDQCGNMYVDKHGDHYGEEEQCVRDMADDAGWECGVRVANKSYWDFCDRCKNNREA